MKLHLPKALCAIVMGAIALPTWGLTSSDIVNNQLDVGIALKTDSKNPQKVTFEGALEVGDGMEVGAFVDGKLMTSFGGTDSTQHSKSLSVTGDVVINGTGKIALGGQTHGNSYMGLYASNVTVNGDSGKMSKSNPNLTATMAYIENLTINSGVVVLRTNDDIATGGYNGYENGDGSKQTMITKSLTVREGGTLYMGKTNGQSATSYKGHYLNAIGKSSSPVTITQSGGGISIYGKTRVKSGLTINQTGGEMLFANESEGRAMIVFDGSTANNITQNGDSDTEMTLGKMGVLGAGALWGTPTSASEKGIVNITQSGAGTINLAKGVEYTSTTASVITQQDDVETGAAATGKINLSGNFTSADFSLQQKATGATINVLGKMDIVGSTINGTLHVGHAATLNVQGALTVADTATLSFGVNQENNTAAMVIDGGSSIVALGAAVSLTLTEALTTTLDNYFTSEDVEDKTMTFNLISNFDATQKDRFTELSVFTTPAAVATLATDDVAYDVKDWSLSVTDNNVLQATVTWQAVKAGEQVPEPATATLSLLALAGLAARRRRR